MKSWYEIYKSRIDNGYYDYFCTKYKYFLDKLVSDIKEASRRKKDEKTILELGCGTANSTRYLIEKFGNKFKYVVVDSNIEMLHLSHENIMSLIGKDKCIDCVFVNNDIFEFLKTRDKFEECLIVHSHGVLEHFDDDSIYKIVSLFSHRQCHYVPSNMYETPSRGDERLMSVEHWKSIVNPYSDFDAFVNIETFNSGFDLIVS